MFIDVNVKGWARMVNLSHVTEIRPLIKEPAREELDPDECVIEFVSGEVLHVNESYYTIHCRVRNAMYYRY